MRTRQGDGHGRGWLLGVLLLTMASMAGCATARVSWRSGDENLAGHYILAHEDGWPISTERAPLTKADYAQHLDAILRGIDEHARGTWPAGGDPSRRQPLRILLFVHGGLNGYDADFARMRSLMQGTPDQAPVFPKTHYYPIFVNWNSALGDSIYDDLFFIRFGRRRPELGVFSWPFVLGARVAESIFGAPNAWMANYDNFQAGDPGLREWAASLFTTPIRSVTTPVLKAFGTSAWQIMKRRADLLVATRLEENPAEAEEGAARTFLARLQVRISFAPSGGASWEIKTGDRTGERGPVEITLVGHSMGALVLNRLLTARHKFPVRRIVTLAPAASIGGVENQMLSYLEENAGAESLTFALNRLDEARERSAWGVLPRGTLLVWIDNFFEPVAALGDKRFGRYRSYREYYKAKEEPRLPMHQFQGVKGEPRRHAEFDDAPFLERILCTVDRDAFRDPAGCDGKTYTREPMGG